MAEKTFFIQQDVYKAHYPAIRVGVYHENSLNGAIIEDFLDTVVDGAIGVAPTYGSRCALVTLALSSISQVLVIRLSSTKSNQRSSGNKVGTPAIGGRALLQDLVLCNSLESKFAFRMDKLAAALHLDLRLHINSGVDLLSVANNDRQSLSAFMTALGGETLLNKSRVSSLFNQQERSAADITATALQAWAACTAGMLDHLSPRLAKVKRIHTEALDEKHLDILAKTIRDADRLGALKPTRVKNEIDKKGVSQKQGKLQVISSRFKTRVMRNVGNQSMEIEVQGQGKKVVGRTTQVNGRAATISIQGPLNGDIRSVTTIGKEAPTSAESKREEVVLHVLQGRSTVMKQPFVQKIWLPKENPAWDAIPATSLASLYFPSSRTLNVSQAKAINVILSSNNADRVALIHGPPGTGKTTVIAAAVTSVMSSADRSRTIWLVAQSNVAVKNIAEKLAAENFVDFKLLVSMDFHYDWHEHLYEQIVGNLIRSDDFVNDVVATERMLLDSRVILCTLSMLSNQRLATIVRLVPPQTVILDEASQIEVGDYFPMLCRFQNTLRKLVFIGDDKQLAPYGSTDVNDLKSIFEMPHLRNRAVFLDIQYRMPVPIGHFVSANVYKNKLKSVHPIQASSCCRFIDVDNGKEEKRGHSWVNIQEVRNVVRVANQFHTQGKSYRIITPYDAQRSQLENELKAMRLPWEDKCFNVDSFQGNEADYIIISLVRSEKIGFLQENRRVNVMLTRCKKGMVICTSRKFVQGKAAGSLVGRLAKELGPHAWLGCRALLTRPNLNLFP